MKAINLSDELNNFINFSVLDDDEEEDKEQNKEEDKKHKGENFKTIISVAAIIAIAFSVAILLILIARCIKNRSTSKKFELVEENATEIDKTKSFEKSESEFGSNIDVLPDSSSKSYLLLFV